MIWTKFWNVISWLLAFICMIGVAACIDAVMVHCTNGVFLENKVLLYSTYIGRVTLGFFLCSKILFPMFLKYFRGDE